MKPAISLEDLVTLTAQLAPLLGGSIAPSEPTRINFPSGIHLIVGKGYYKETGRLQFNWYSSTQHLYDANKDALRLHVAATRSLNFTGKKLQVMKAAAEESLKRLQDYNAEQARLRTLVVAAKATMSDLLDGTAGCHTITAGATWLRWHTATGSGNINIEPGAGTLTMSLTLPPLGIEHAESVLRAALEMPTFESDTIT